MRYFILVLILCGVVIHPSAQEKNYDWGVKASLFSVLLGDYVTDSWAASVAVDKRLGGQYSFQQEAGYIFTDRGNTGGFLFVSTDKVHGVKLDSEVRRYIERNKQPKRKKYLCSRINQIILLTPLLEPQKN